MNMIFLRKWLPFIIILLIAVFLRFYQLGQNPPELTWDEVAFGYNAYSIGIDGRDEFGSFLPIAYFESFGDYKPTAYLYLDVLPIKLFGLTPFAVRFPSVFLGVLTVVLTYFLTKRIFYSSEKKEIYALASMFVLALSPWHIMLSRAAFEANVATFFLVAGVWAFLAGIQEKKWYLIFSAISFVLAMNTFNSSRIVAPLLAVMLCIMFFKKLLQRKKQVIIAALVGLVLLAPLIPFLFSPRAATRFQEVNFFSDRTILEKATQEITNDNNTWWSSVIHNRRFAYGLEFFKHYFDNINPSFLFVRGDNNPKFSIQYVGQLYLWDIPFFVIGLLFLLRKREGYWWLIPVWLLIGLIPASVARETPHALRTEAALPTFQLFVGYGVAISGLFIAHSVRKRWLKKSIFAGILLLLALNVFYFQFEYYVQYPQRFSGVWQYGYRQLIAYVTSQTHYKTIYDAGYLGRPYIYYLFYTKTDPNEFRRTMEVTRDSYGFVAVKKFDKYIFTDHISNEKHSGDALYIVKIKDIPGDAKIIKEIPEVNGQPEIGIYSY